MNSKPERFRFHLTLALGVVAAAVIFLSGCKGVSTRSERQARADLKAVTQSYRPGGRKATLPALDTNATLGVFLNYAMLNQPRIEAAYHDYAAAVERITVERSLPDPQFSFQMDIQNIVTSVMPGIMGTIPWPGKLRAGASIATAGSQSKYAVFQSAVLTSAFEVKRTYYQLHFLSEKIRVNQETLQLLGNLEKLARAQNETGRATLQDVLRAQIEQDRLRTEIANLDDSRSSLMAQFKAALGLGGNDPEPPVPSRFESTPLDISAENLFKTAFAQNARLKAMEAGIRAAEASIILAQRSRLPDFSLGLMADAKMDPTLYRPLGTVSLPIWRDKIAAQIAEAQAGTLSARAQLSGEQIQLAVDFAGRSYLYREATRNLALLNDDLLPKARQSLEVARSGYLTGRTDFFNLADTQRTLLGFELDRVEASMQREVVLAELSLIIQGMPPANAPMGAVAARMQGGAQPSLNKANRGGM